MKVTVDSKEPSEPKSQFPFLGVSRGGGWIVLFSSYGTGTVMNTSGHCKVGDSSMDWNMSEFNIFQGSITLSND